MRACLDIKELLRHRATDAHASMKLMQDHVITVLTAVRQMQLHTSSSSPCIEADVEAYPPAAAGEAPGQLPPGQAGNGAPYGLAAEAAAGAVEAARGLAPADRVHGGRGGRLDPVGRELWAVDAVPSPRPVPQQGQHADPASQDGCSSKRTGVSPQSPHLSPLPMLCMTKMLVEMSQR